MGFYASFAKFEADFDAGVLFIYICHFLIQDRVIGGMFKHSFTHSLSHTQTHTHTRACTTSEQSQINFEINGE
jgi:hypothetical protein